MVEELMLDTSALYEWVRGSAEQTGSLLPHLVEKRLIVSWMQLAELTSVLERRGINSNLIITAIQENMKIVAPIQEDFLVGGFVQSEARRDGSTKFSLMDGVILATARRIGISCITFDSDMRNLSDVICLG